MWGDENDRAPEFISRGYWELGWSDEHAPAGQVPRRDQIRKGDRIAIKRMMGAASSHIRITALGIVTGVNPRSKRIRVDWVVPELDRVVESRGAYGSIHAPYSAEDLWIREVFCL
jgi:hypothetical protein